MTEKKQRFQHKHNMLGMQFICYDDKDILLGTFADKDGVEHIVDKLNAFQEENEQLKAQLYCDSDEGVCRICKHHYVEKGNIFYISKCEKGHEECSKEDLRHCKDFEIKECKND